MITNHWKLQVSLLSYFFENIFLRLYTKQLRHKLSLTFAGSAVFNIQDKNDNAPNPEQSKIPHVIG
jgi:hypothetical protein